MIVYFSIFLIIVYILGVFVTNACDDELTINSVRMSLIWPILLFIVFIKTILYLINEILMVLLLAIGFEYRRTRLYNFIEKLL